MTIEFILGLTTAVGAVYAVYEKARSRRQRARRHEAEARVREAEAGKLLAEKRAAEAEADKLRADAENIVGQTFKDAMKAIGEELGRVRGVARDLERQNARQEHQIQLRGKEVQELNRSVAGLREAHGACEERSANLERMNAKLEERQTELGMQVQSQQGHIRQMEETVAGLRRELDAARTKST